MFLTNEQQNKVEADKKRQGKWFIKKIVHSMCLISARFSYFAYFYALIAQMCGHYKVFRLGLFLFILSYSITREKYNKKNTNNSAQDLNASCCLLHLTFCTNDSIKVENRVLINSKSDTSWI